ncbi:MAG TPA: nuclear transport factor 2 family protein [Bryobacteraceae bacterium]|jgi:hypothetical protein|nr:nuclear transport factor 2 family protein [Bryobacteraceae bacterium]
MRERIRFAWITVAVLGTMVWGCAAGPGEQDQLLQTRDAVWRAWFANDTQVLGKLVPKDAIVISAGEEKWKNQADVFRSAAEFRAGGGKLIRLEFPRTQIQRFADVAVVYTEYVLETEVGGKRSLDSGRATEIFVFRRGEWVNAGWHTDSRK